MISDITLGQFFPGNSLLHRLDPRTKIILAVIFISAVFVANTPGALCVMLIATLVTVLIGRISVKVLIKGLKPIILILVFTSLLNLFITTGDHLIYQFPFVPIAIYWEGVIRAVFMATRVIILIIGSSMFLTYTTSPIALTDGLESLLSPLKKIKLPVHSLAMMMSIALRFIPTLIEETEKIMNAQKSRGADFASGGLIKRAKALIPILIPLFVSSFKRADELATAMECRCYRGDVNRTKLVKLELRAADVLSIIGMVLFLALIICMNVLPPLFEVNNIVYNVIFYRI